MFFSELKNIDEKLKHLLIIIAWMIIFVGAFYILNILKPIIVFILKVLMPFIVGLILAYIFDPIVTVFQKRLKLPRFIGLIVFYVIIILIISLFLLLILPEIFKQISELISNLQIILPEKFNYLKHKYDIPINEDEIRILLNKFKITNTRIEQAAGAITPGLTSAASSGVSVIGNILKGIMKGLGHLFSFFSILMFIIIINFYFIMDFSKIKPVIEKMLPKKDSPKIMDLLSKIDVAVGGFMRGQAIDCLIIGILTTTALLLMGFSKYAILIGFISGIGNAIPYLGPLAGGASSILWILFSDTYPDMNTKLIGIAILIGVFGIIQTIDGLILQPKIVGKNSQLHPLAVLLALYIGAQFGFAGMIIAIPAACIIRVLLKELWWNKIIEEKQ